MTNNRSELFPAARVCDMNAFIHVKCSYKTAELYFFVYKFNKIHFDNSASFRANIIIKIVSVVSSETSNR